MALDFCLITKDGVPMESAPIGPPEHRELMAVARRTRRTPLLMRMVDYYEDVVWDAGEVPVLASELSWLIEHDGCPDEVAETAMLMLSICEYAESEGAAIEAISDDRNEEDGGGAR